MNAGTLTKVPVSLGQRSYDILVGHGALDRLGPMVAPMASLPRVHVIADEHVWRLHGDQARASLDAAKLSHALVSLPAGEAIKSFATLESVCETLLASGMERGDVIVAFGGGTVGDLAGFAAAILLRGIGFVQVPTSLLAQVDSSVGGKTAINSRAGKNLVGAFYQPRLVLADTGLLATLPRRELNAGYAEIVKYGLINDPDFFDWCCDNGAALLAGDADAQRHAVAQSCRAKAGIVGRDETEKGDRALLNLGHTFAHALERETGFSTSLLHGEAVALGIVLAFDLSVRLGLCPEADAARVRAHFRETGMPADLADPAFGLAGASPDRLVAHMAHDKKVSGGRITFILARGIGKAYVAHDTDLEQVRALLAAALNRE